MAPVPTLTVPRRSRIVRFGGILIVIFFILGRNKESVFPWLRDNFSDPLKEIMSAQLATTKEVKSLPGWSDLASELEEQGLSIEKNAVFLCPDLTMALQPAVDLLDDEEPIPSDLLYPVIDLTMISGMKEAKEAFIQFLNTKLGYDTKESDVTIGIRIKDLIRLYGACGESFSEAVESAIPEQAQVFLEAINFGGDDSDVDEDESEDTEDEDTENEDEDTDEEEEEEVGPAPAPTPKPVGVTPTLTSHTTLPTLPLQSDLGTLNQVRMGLADIKMINPDASFQRGPLVSTAIQVPRFSSKIEVSAPTSATTRTGRAPATLTAQQQALEVARQIEPAKIHAGRVSKGDPNYYTTDELKDFARRMGLPVSGSKAEIIERIKNVMRQAGVIA